MKQRNEMVNAIQRMANARKLGRPQLLTARTLQAPCKAMRELALKKMLRTHNFVRLKQAPSLEYQDDDEEKTDKDAKKSMLREKYSGVSKLNVQL